jgi:hypothetical protein
VTGVGTFTVLGSGWLQPQASPYLGEDGPAMVHLQAEQSAFAFGERSKVGDGAFYVEVDRAKAIRVGVVRQPAAALAVRARLRRFHGRANSTKEDGVFGRVR